MKFLSAETKRFLCVVLLLVSALAFWFLKQATTVRVSDDPLSVGIGERWNAALPDGFTKESVERIDGAGGYNYACLTYEKDIANYLGKWTAPDEDFQTRFDALVAGALAGGDFSEEDAALVERTRPSLDETYVCFSLTDETRPENTICLCYRAEDRTMVLVERFLPREEA